MKKKQVMAVVAGVACSAIYLAGCGSDSAATATTAAAATTAAETTAAAADTAAETAGTGAEEASEGAAETEKESRTIVVGTMGTGEPYSLIADDGTWTGVEPELWAEIEKRTGWTIEVKQIGDLASVFGELNTGRVDVAANCYAITEARLETYLASDPIYADAQVVIVQPDSSYQTLEDLRGHTVGVTAGQASQSTIEALAPEYDFEVVTYEDPNAGFQDCALGRIDSYANTVTNIEKAERAQGLEFRQLEEKLFGNNVGWWFADTGEGAALRDEINEVIAEMHADGTISEITTKWFYEDLSQLISDEWLTADR